MKEERKENPNFIQVQHGKLNINIPRKMFKRGTSDLVGPEAEKFIRTLSSRYPWLSKEALHVILEESRETMEQEIEQRRSAHDKARERISRGDLNGALQLVEDQLIRNPQDADAWYVAGEILCKLGRMQEGYQAIGRARDLSKATS